MDYSAEYLPEKGSLLHGFHDLLDELGFSFSDDAFYEVMDGTHPVYRKDDEEPSDADDAAFDAIGEDSGNGNGTFDSDGEDSDNGNDTFNSDGEPGIEAETDTSDMDEDAGISDFEAEEDAREYPEAA